MPIKFTQCNTMARFNIWPDVVRIPNSSICRSSGLRFPSDNDNRKIILGNQITMWSGAHDLKGKSHVSRKISSIYSAFVRMELHKQSGCKGRDECLRWRDQRTHQCSEGRGSKWVGGGKEKRNRKRKRQRERKRGRGNGRGIWEERERRARRGRRRIMRGSGQRQEEGEEEREKKRRRRGSFLFLHK